jgi:peptide deformylase
MALRNIVKDTDELLHKKSRPVTEFNQKLWSLLEDMAETMYKADGVGLAGPQVGVLRRLAVIDVGDGIVELINPEIIKESGSQVGQEGCLSSPGVWADVKRPMKVTVRAQDRNGEWFEVKGTELFARALCHEIDHLDGILFMDRAKEQEKETGIKVPVKRIPKR